MARRSAYYRPASVSEALEIIEREGGRAAFLAGGTDLVARLGKATDAIVDLQAAGLDGVEIEADRATLGAMTRLRTIISHLELPELLRTTALQEGPNTIRNAGTLGGVVVGASPESELLAGLLVCDTEVTIETSSGVNQLALDAFLADVEATLKGGLLTKVTLVTTGHMASERVARTPADRAIVAVVGRKDESGGIALACCGVAATPVLVSLDQLGGLTPPEDFRGTSTYRREMAITLSRRVIRALEVE